jgi:hypothetical protein
MLAHKRRKDTRTKDQLKLATAKALIRVLRNNINQLDPAKAELVARANRWLERN